MDLLPEDVKLVTLARASRARTAAPQGAAVRDQDGRTYAAATVTLPSLQVDALDLAVAMAVSSGARSLEGCAVVGGAVVGGAVVGGAVVGGAIVGGEVPGIAAVRDLAGDGIAVVMADEAGIPIEVVTT
jgi:hypothetical protein